MEFLADQVGWLLGDAACLVMVALFMPLVPVFKRSSVASVRPRANSMREAAYLR